MPRRDLAAPTASLSCLAPVPDPAPGHGLPRRQPLPGPVVLLMAQVAGHLLSQPHVPRVNERRNEPSVTAPAPPPLRYCVTGQHAGGAAMLRARRAGESRTAGGA